jgi:diguanylate cyclase (GGDEF)-like protein
MQAIGSTIELNDLLELIYEQISIIIPSDTYFVSLYDPVENLQDIRVLFDDGQRFPPTRVPAGEGLNSWVIQNQHPLLIHHMSEEIHSLPVRPIRLIQDRLSESWMGVPMLVGERCLGVLAIASYTPYAFSDDDASLLTSLASQAALAVDNARQHERVKEQARRDSLTGVYNHGHLLLTLDEEVGLGRKQRTPVSLIMLDVDYFKEYNDRYGHVVGDEVLCRLVQVIQAHIKDSGVVATIGRWGGEEFAIGLPGSTEEQALQVAHGIRDSLAQVILCDKSGALIPSPTVSQGIATFPHDAMNTAELVDVADEALYVAKGAGRDRIVMANGSLDAGSSLRNIDTR